jgi:hypothetical protein
MISLLIAAFAVSSQACCVGGTECRLPLRLLGRLPPERAASFFSGRHPRSLNDSGGSIAVRRMAAIIAPF